jgi:hypothetical protein
VTEDQQAPDETELPPVEEVEEVPDDDAPTPDPVHSAIDASKPLGVQSSVWRLGPGGLLLSSVIEDQAGWLASLEPNTIFFYADLGGSEKLTHSEETMQKVYVALSSQGLSEGQIINAVSAMQNSGIYFRESDV